MSNHTRTLLILLVGCGHSDAPPQPRPPEDAPRTQTLRPPAPMDAPQPLLIQNIEPGNPPASMVVVTSHPKFYIDRTEVTAGDYRECVAANVCKPPLAEKWKTWDARRAVTMVKPIEAWDYCAYRGKRLPTRDEWMRAALGEDGRKFPWGNAAPSCKFVVLFPCSRDVVNVGSKPAGASPYGALDMAGNVGEFVNDDSSGQRERLDAVTMGGSLDATLERLGEYFESNPRRDHATSDEEMGFRCALTPKP